MTDILLIYAVMQLMSTAFGLAVIGAVRSSIEEKLQDKGYVLKNRNSLYKFNEKLGNFLKGFIPFYYAIKAVSLVQGKNPINRAVEEEIMTCDVLLIDDIGAENNSPWSRDEVLGTILQYRMDSDLTTFFTSNFTINELETELSETNKGTDLIKARRIIERIKYLTVEDKLISKDKR